MKTNNKENINKEINIEECNEETYNGERDRLVEEVADLIVDLKKSHRRSLWSIIYLALQILTLCLAILGGFSFLFIVYGILISVKGLIDVSFPSSKLDVKLGWASAFCGAAIIVMELYRMGVFSN